MSRNISRRSFLKGSAASALGVVALGMAPAGVAEGAQETKKTAQAAPAVPGVAGVVNRATMEHRAWDDPAIQLKVRWSGVNFYEFVLPNGKTIVMDPYFDDPNDTHNEYKYTPTDLPGGQWVHGADVVLLTHGHFDHTGELPSVLENYPAAHVVAPENAMPSIIFQHEKRINYAGHYFHEASAHDKFEFPGFTLETCRSNHNCSKYPTADSLDPAKYLNEDGSVNFYKLYAWIYEREIMNMKITTDEGFTILIWNSEMQADGMGFESRAYFYRDANPDLFMYQVAGASFDYDRRNPNCKHMGEWIASVKGRAALPEHQQHFSYDELDAMAEKFSDICNEKNVGTSFLTPETGVWYGYMKDAEGNVSVCLVDEA
ncbi:MAG: MBL fold metallo-hydrolase [Clostridia bacterium]|nr:MBL fold metallo-hydrolase [Clostridia bacterium]